MERKAIVDLGRMYLDGTLPKQFSEGEKKPDEALRAGFNRIMELSDDNKVLDYKVFRDHKVEIFAILEEIIQVDVHEGLTDILAPFVEYRNLALGDTNKFIVPNNKYFRVATISDGNGNLRRQRLRDGEEYTVPVHIKGVKIYEEFARFMAGRIDFTEMVRLVAESMVKEVKEEVYRAVLTNFREGGAGEPYRLTISGRVPTEREVLTMAKHLEAKTGAKAVIYGTALALASMDIKYPDEASKARYNDQGFFGKIAGVEAVEIPPMHEAGTDDFIFEDDAILLLPQTGDKMVKVVNEGSAIIHENNFMNREDMQAEYLLTQKMGVTVIPSSQFGYIKFQGQ